MIKKVFPIIAVSVFAAQIGVGIISPIISVYAHDLGATGLWVGLVFGGYHVSRVLVTPLIGRWSDRRGRRLVVGSGLFLAASISLLYIFAESMPMLVTVRIFHGLVSGMVLPPARAWIAEISPAGEEGRWQGYFNTALFSGLGVGPLLGGVLSDYLNIDAAFAAMGLLNLLAFVLVASLLREGSERKASNRPTPSFRAIGKSRLFQALFIQRLVKESSVMSFMAFMPLYLNKFLDISLTLVGVLIAANLFLGSWLQIYTGRVADRFDRRSLVIIGAITSFSAVLMIPFAANLWQLIVLFIFRALGSSLTMPGNAALSVSIGKRLGMGSTIGLMAVAIGIGAALGPILGGLVAEFMGIRSVFFFAAGIGYIGITLFALLSRNETKESGTKTEPKPKPAAR